MTFWIPIRASKVVNQQDANVVFACPNGHRDTFRVDIEDEPGVSYKQLNRRVRCTTCEATCGIEIHLPGEAS